MMRTNIDIETVWLSFEECPQDDVLTHLGVRLDAVSVHPLVLELIESAQRGWRQSL
jgi:hypothetical protein